MLDDLKENNNEMLVIPARQTWMLRFLLVILVLMILAVVGLAFFLKKNKSVRTVKTVPTELSDLETVEQNLVWLNKQKDTIRAYTVGSVCDFNFNCKDIFPSNTTGFSVLWAENKYLQKNNNDVELEIFKRNVNLYADRNRIKKINNNFWNCYFMWNIWNNKNLDQDIKDNVEKICFDSTYESVYVDEIVDFEEMKKGVDAIVVDLINNQEVINSQLIPSLVNNEELSKKPVENHYFFNSSDRFSRYLWRKNNNDLSNGLVDFQKSLEDYKNGQNKVKAYEGCQTGIASLMLSSIFSDSKYLNLSKIILDQQINKINQDSLKDVSVCGFLASRLFEQTQDEIFEVKKKEIIKNFVKNNFDQKNGGFYSKTEIGIIKDVKYNGLMTGLLIN